MASRRIVRQPVRIPVGIAPAAVPGGDVLKGVVRQAWGAGKKASAGLSV